MKPKIFISLTVGLSCLLLLTAVFDAPGQAQVAPDLTIFYTSDCWGYLEPCG